MKEKIVSLIRNPSLRTLILVLIALGAGYGVNDYTNESATPDTQDIDVSPLALTTTAGTAQMYSVKGGYKVYGGNFNHTTYLLDGAGIRAENIVVLDCVNASGIELCRAIGRS